MNIYFFGEDSPTKSVHILKNIVIKSLHCIEPLFNPSDAEFNINSSNFFGLTLQGNHWKQKKPTSNFDDLCSFIADIYQNDDEFIFWHIDADTTWSNDAGYQLSKNILQLEEIVFKKVEAFSNSKKKAFNKDELYKKLILVEPFYSIESWLYENYEIVRDSHKPHYEALKKFKEKHGDTFDLISQVKEKTSVKDEINIELSNNFPSSRINQIGMSYSLFLSLLKENLPLNEAIPKRQTLF
ncbi:MAG: hypothetical protein PHY93_08735 [Bacteriovorax sp.]|nr:hypothetical protein [Bacteriovorax sp.]